LIPLSYFFATQLLTLCGWEVIEPCGGASMVAKPSAYMGRIVKGGAFGDEKLESHNIRDAILKVTGLVVSSSSWTGIPDYFRFMIALTDTDFANALNALLKFRDSVFS